MFLSVNHPEFILVSMIFAVVNAVVFLKLYKILNQMKNRELSVSSKPVSGENDLMLSLPQVYEQQRQLINNFSHELRTPLTLVYGYMQSIRRRNENLTDLQKEALEIAIFEMERTIDLMKGIFDLARLDQDSIRFSFTSVCLTSVIKKAIAHIQQVSDREIKVEGGELKITVLADAEQLKQVLIRLIDNAIRYSDLGIMIKLEKLGNYVTLSVSDRGSGIPVSDQPHIFSPFFRVDRSRNRHTGGVGLGLAIAKVLVEGMGGSLSVRSELGKGSIFKVMLKSAV
jgi:signal transduction histidine kinase